MTLSSYKFNPIKHGRTLATELMECDDDGDAMQKAKELLSTSTFESVEVWQKAVGCALVSVHVHGRTALEQEGAA